MNDQEKIDAIKNSLSRMALSDIKRAQLHCSPVASFILCSCLIDAMAGFRYGWTKNDERSNRKLYIDFVKNYLHGYDPVDLYTDLRCGLVHNYSAGYRYAFISKNPDWHRVIRNNFIYINLGNFVSDIESAMHKYFSELDRDNEIRQLAMRRYDSLNIIVKNEPNKSNQIILVEKMKNDNPSQ